MKEVIQLDAAGYLVGTAIADESPLEPGVFLMPAHSIDVSLSSLPTCAEHQRLRWKGVWVVEDVPVVVAEVETITEVPQQPLPEPPVNDTPQWFIDRVRNYPDIAVYLDGVVKGDQAQIDAYIAACLAVKAKFPKPDSEAALASGADGGV